MTNPTTIIRTNPSGSLAVRTVEGRFATLSRECLRSLEATGSDVDQDVADALAQLIALPIRDEDSIAALVAELAANYAEGDESADAEAIWSEYASEVVRLAQQPQDCFKLARVVAMHVADCLSQGCSPAELAGQSDDDALEGWDANGICDALGLDRATTDLDGDEYRAGCRRLAREIRAEARRYVEAA